jgi:hypothetical protein
VRKEEGMNRMRISIDDDEEDEEWRGSKQQMKSTLEKNNIVDPTQSIPLQTIPSLHHHSKDTRFDGPIIHHNDSSSESMQSNSKKSRNVVVMTDSDDSNISTHLTAPFTKRTIQDGSSSESDIPTPFSRSKRVRRRMGEKRVTRSMNTSPDVYSLPSSEELLEERVVKKVKRVKEVVLDEEEDCFEDIMSYSDDNHYQSIKLFCHVCKLEQPIDNFSTKQQQQQHDRYCLLHTWAGGQCNYSEKKFQEYQYEVRCGIVSDYESDGFVTTTNE